MASARDMGTTRGEWTRIQDYWKEPPEHDVCVFVCLCVYVQVDFFLQL